MDEHRLYHFLRLETDDGYHRQRNGGGYKERIRLITEPEERRHDRVDDDTGTHAEHANGSDFSRVLCDAHARRG